MRRGNKWHDLPLADFFWDRVRKAKSNECWIWVGPKYVMGYGECRRKYAHRVSWELKNGKIPKGLHILHKCDNPPCVNPKHLYAGSNTQNRRDARDRCRYPGGAKSSRAVLTAHQVREMKIMKIELYPTLSRERAAELIAKNFPVTRFAVRDILAGKRWAHVEI